MRDATLVVYVLVYAGMFLGRAPGLGLDRVGIALVGAIAVIALGSAGDAREWSAAIDAPTLALLFGLMIVSAQFRLGGFYARVVRGLGAAEISPARLLGGVVAASGLLSALLTNDIICLAMTPPLIDLCSRRRLDPKPFLLALACSANVGSAATLIGNPQNMLIGQKLGLSFARYLAQGAVPAALGLGVVWAWASWLARGTWAAEPLPADGDAREPDFDAPRTAKALAVLGALILVFLFAPVPRETAALAAAGLLLVSRRTRSRDAMAMVDSPLLILFISLFIVNHALARSGNLDRMMSGLAGLGIDPARPGWLFGLSFGLSNLVSNVPAVMLLLQSATHPLAGAILALSSTLAGNLIVVGSIANVIVIEQAARRGVALNWRDHARMGVPVTAATLAFAAAWLALIG